MNYNRLFLLLGALIVIVYIYNIYSMHTVSEFESKINKVSFTRSPNFKDFIKQFNDHISNDDRDIIGINSNIYIKNSLDAELKEEIKKNINKILNLSNRINNWNNSLVSIERVKEDINSKNIKKLYVTFFMNNSYLHSIRKMFLIYTKKNKTITFNHLQLL